MLVRLLPRTTFLMLLSYLQSQQLLLTLHPYLKSSIFSSVIGAGNRAPSMQPWSSVVGVLSQP